MNKRVVVLLVICALLGITVMTVRFIEKEKEAIKARFLNVPMPEEVKVKRLPPILPPQEETGTEEEIPLEREDKAVTPAKMRVPGVEGAITPQPAGQSREKLTPGEGIDGKKRQEAIPMEDEAGYPGRGDALSETPKTEPDVEPEPQKPEEVEESEREDTVIESEDEAGEAEDEDEVEEEAEDEDKEEEEEDEDRKATAAENIRVGSQKETEKVPQKGIEGEEADGTDEAVEGQVEGEEEGYEGIEDERMFFEDVVDVGEEGEVIEAEEDVEYVPSDDEFIFEEEEGGEEDDSFVEEEEFVQEE